MNKVNAEKHFVDFYFNENDYFNLKDFQFEFEGKSYKIINPHEVTSSRDGQSSNLNHSFSQISSHSHNYNNNINLNKNYNNDNNIFIGAKTSNLLAGSTASNTPISHYNNLNIKSNISDLQCSYDVSSLRIKEKDFNCNKLNHENIVNLDEANVEN